MATLINYLEAHGVKVVDNTDSTITVNTIFVKDGVTFEELETVKADAASIRAYLGY